MWSLRFYSINEQVKTNIKTEAERKCKASREARLQNAELLRPIISWVEFSAGLPSNEEFHVFWDSSFQAIQNGEAWQRLKCKCGRKETCKAGDVICRKKHGLERTGNVWLPAARDSGKFWRDVDCAVARWPWPNCARLSTPFPFVIFTQGGCYGHSFRPQV